MKKILILVNNKILKQKIRLALFGRAEILPDASILGAEPGNGGRIKPEPSARSGDSKPKNSNPEPSAESGEDGAGKHTSKPSARLGEDGAGRHISEPSARFGFTEDAVRPELVIREGNGCIFVGTKSLALPLSLSELISAVENRSAEEFPRLTLEPSERRVTFGSEVVKLTDAEFRLLSALVKAGGQFVSRDSLLYEVWDGSAGGSVVNVYVHYLREKLERGGVKLILSSRAEGYKIDRRYLTDADDN